MLDHLSLDRLHWLLQSIFLNCPVLTGFQHQVSGKRALRPSRLPNCCTPLWPKYKHAHWPWEGPKSRGALPTSPATGSGRVY